MDGEVAPFGRGVAQGPLCRLLVAASAIREVFRVRTHPAIAASGIDQKPIQQLVADPLVFHGRSFNFSAIE